MLPAAPTLQAAAREAERLRLEREAQRKEYEAQQVGKAAVRRPACVRPCL